MTIDSQDSKHIIADEGKEFMRIVSEERYGKEIYLGYSYYIGGVLQDPPHLDVAEDFIEVDEIVPEPEPIPEEEQPQDENNDLETE